jgi:hypothetical protein
MSLEKLIDIARGNAFYVFCGGCALFPPLERVGKTYEYKWRPEWLARFNFSPYAICARKDGYARRARISGRLGESNQRYFSIFPESEIGS